MRRCGPSDAQRPEDYGGAPDGHHDRGNGGSAHELAAHRSTSHLAIVGARSERRRVPRRGRLVFGVA